LQEHVFEFWELMDQLLNLILFGLLGIQVIAMQPSVFQFLLCATAVPVALLARWLSVVVPLGVMSRFRRYDDDTVAILTWGGLRGGLSVALALSLPAFPGREIVLGSTYSVVIFSILVQALTLGPLVTTCASAPSTRAAAARAGVPASSDCRAHNGAIPSSTQPTPKSTTLSMGCVALFMLDITICRTPSLTACRGGAGSTRPA
jgi:CPA1 family monovalent cation:H+ antiporter